MPVTVTVGHVHDPTVMTHDALPGKLTSTLPQSAFINDPSHDHPGMVGFNLRARHNEDSFLN
jgi:hypothetical protein